MSQQILFDPALIMRYDQSGPRYASYPTVARFHSDITEDDYRHWARSSNEDPIPRPLSLYFHIPSCDSACFYCACNKVVTRDHIRAADYLQRLHREIALQAALFDRDRIVEQLHWGGGTPTYLDAGQCRELMRITRKHFTLRSGDGGEYSVEADPCSVDHDKLSVLRDIGFNRISLGIQDFDPDIRKAVNRIQSAELTRNIMEHARSLGFKSINLDLMYGLPLQTVDTFTRTLQQTIALQPDRIAVYNYAHLPERFKPQRHTSEAGLPPADVKLDLLQHTISMLTDAGYIHIGMDHFAKPDDELALAQQNGTLHRNFQGYSTRVDCDMIGMGVCAIGRVCDNYSQNARNLDRYNQLLDAGRLPLERGIELEPDDLLRREIILRLICDFRLDIAALESRWRFDFRNYFRHEYVELERLQNDGLLSIDTDSLEVLPAGRLLVRNICMVFDRYLHNGGSKTRFSKVI
ncbi:MAG TPA: oxygen-independent coproporphyrinogen III oxidase [Gammaproteobacteria bacterium]|nr:oxygen-independent coproporphyrinogen III oxidase [Gammaproteobacteria bacterium]